MNIKFPILKTPGGTAKLSIKRIGHRKEDYEVDLESLKDHKYKIGKTDYHGVSEEAVVCIGQVEYF